MNNISPIMEKYNAVINLCRQSRAYYRHAFCGTKNGSQYLKIVTKKGTYFTPYETQVIDNFVTQIAGVNKAVSMNRETGTLSVTFYEPNGIVQKQVASRSPVSPSQGRLVRR